MQRGRGISDSIMERSMLSDKEDLGGCELGRGRDNVTGRV